jgi:hypothetical protein
MVNSILGDTTEEVPTDELIKSPLSLTKVALLSSSDGGDRRMVTCICAFLRLVDPVVEKFLGVGTPLRMVSMLSHDLFKFKI